MEREEMTLAESQTAFAAICYWVGSKLTHSVYVLNCSTATEAERKAYDYFFDKRGPICQQIERIEVLPQGVSRWANSKPIFTRQYQPTCKQVA